MKSFSYKTSQKILKVLAEVSTKEHAEQIIKRNTEALEKGSSNIHCPHCSSVMNCKNCLWAYAIKHVTKKSNNKLDINMYSNPCIFVSFINKKIKNSINHSIPLSIYLCPTMLKLCSLDSSNKNDGIQWLKAHINWAKNMEWGKRKVKGYNSVVIK